MNRPPHSIVAALYERRKSASVVGPARNRRTSNDARSPGGSKNHPLCPHLRLAALASLASLILFVAPLHAAEPSTPPARPRPFTVMTYNIHHGEGTDGRLDLKRIADLIRDQNADLVALQEVDRGVRRTDGRDLPAELSRLTGMQAIFENNYDFQGGEYGNAILSRFPILWHTNLHYPMLRQGEQRGLLLAGIKLEQGELLFACTHLDYRPDPAERLAHVAFLKQARDRQRDTPAIVAGDLNDFPRSEVHRRLLENHRDVWELVGEGEGHTYPSTRPDRRIDYLLVDPSGPLRPLRAWTICRHASDHCALGAEISWDPGINKELLRGEQTAAPSPPH